jgi:hypothetical protein
MLLVLGRRGFDDLFTVENCPMRFAAALRLGMTGDVSRECYEVCLGLYDIGFSIGGRAIKELLMTPVTE